MSSRCGTGLHPHDQHAHARDARGVPRLRRPRAAADGGRAPTAVPRRPHPWTPAGSAASPGTSRTARSSRTTPAGWGAAPGTTAARSTRQSRTPTTCTASSSRVGGPVEMFASSGGAVSALDLVAAHPGDVTTLVAHEPPMLGLLPDADRAFAAERDVQAAYHDKGWGYGMAAFIALTSWQGEFPDDWSARFRRGSGDVRPPGRRRRLPRRPAAVGRLQCHHRLPARRRGAGGGADPRGDRGRCRVAGPGHRAHLGRGRRGHWARRSRTSPATTVGSWAASSASAVSRRPLPPGCARCSTSVEPAGHVTRPFGLPRSTACPASTPTPRSPRPGRPTRTAAPTGPGTPGPPDPRSAPPVGHRIASLDRNRLRPHRERPALVAQPERLDLRVTDHRLLVRRGPIARVVGEQASYPGDVTVPPRALVLSDPPHHAASIHAATLPRPRHVARGAQP